MQERRCPEEIDFDSLPNQRLHLTPRYGHRGRDRVCYRCWLLAIQHSFRGAGEPRPLGRTGKSSSNSKASMYSLSILPRERASAERAAMRNWVIALLILASGMASAQTVTYPLTSGDLWEFGWAFLGEPGYPPAPAIVLGDSTMTNGLRYALIRYTDSSIVAERQSGDSVFRFNPKLGNEYLLFDFGASPGDTVGRIGDQDIVLEKRDTAYVLYAQRRRWLFSIYPPRRPVDSGRLIWISDSIGVSRIVESWGSYCDLYGARINGVKYGYISSVSGKGVSTNGMVSTLEVYPNPFNASLQIAVDVVERSQVRLEVFNSLGQRMVVLADRMLDKGLNHFALDASRWASGIYVLRATTGGRFQSTRLVLAK
jgi:hypothetical protein